MTSLRYFSRWLAVRVGNKWGVVRPNGTVMIEPQFDAVDAFSDALLKVKIGKKWGLVNHRGKLALKPKYDEIRLLREGLGVVRAGNRWGIIYRKIDEGEEDALDEKILWGLVKPRFDEIRGLNVAECKPCDAIDEEEEAHGQHPGYSLPADEEHHDDDDLDPYGNPWPDWEHMDIGGEPGD